MLIAIYGNVTSPDSSLFSHFEGPVLLETTEQVHLYEA